MEMATCVFGSALGTQWLPIETKLRGGSDGMGKALPFLVGLAQEGPCFQVK